MAPDVNSLPASPRLGRTSLPVSQTPSNNPSRRSSQLMGPPTVPASAMANPHHLPHPPAHVSPTTSSNEQSGVPMRHPRPLTAAELYLECEKEQEAVVNRLTRELTALRAQSASVASNASHSSTSTSASLLPVDISDPNPNHQLIGATHPTPSRRHRSSSSVSGRSAATPSTSTSASTNVSTHAHSGSTTSVPIGGVSQASADRAAAAGASSLSRQPSVSASGTSTPARQSLDIPRQPASHYTLPHRPSVSRDPSQTTVSSTQAQAGTPHPPSFSSPTQSPIQSTSINAAMQHFADTAAYRTEMEIVKAENESLRQQIRSLERALRARNRRDSSQSDAPRPDPRASRDAAEGASRVHSVASPASSLGMGVATWAAGDGGVGGVAGPRERSESQSTTASSRRGMGIPEDDVRLGESASSAGVGRGN